MKTITEKELAQELRDKYLKNPPDGMSVCDIENMSDNALLDMDYFLHEDDDFWDDEDDVDGFYIF